MHILNLDIEDYSPVPVEYGVYRRAEEGEIILISYSLDGAPVVTIDLTEEEMPPWLLAALTDPNYRKKAYNAPYERNYFNAFFGIYSVPEQWECTLVRAAMCGLPLSLDESSKALGLIEKKDPVGKALIRLFCIPDRYGNRIMPSQFPEKWQQFKQYNNQDVVVEMGVDKACAWYRIPEIEHHIWCLCERKNERGVRVDLDLIDAAMYIDKLFRDELIAEGTALTGLSNVNSPKQLKDWLLAETGEEVTTLNKLAVHEMLQQDNPDHVKRLLELRQLLSKTSIKKYASMKNAACWDGRVRGMFQYYGANRTGRESGRICQPQNYPRISDEFAEFLEDARELVKARDIDMLKACFDNLSNVLSQLLRTCFISDDDKELVVLDFKSIEALVLACIADEGWRIQFFQEGGDIYKKSASLMFKKAVEQISKDDRQKGKVAELACGYGGAAGAIEKMNDLILDKSKRIPLKEIKGIPKAWREANPNIVEFWWEMDRAAKEAIKTGQIQPVKHGIAFGMSHGNLLMKLPSGRCLVYQKAHLRQFYVAFIDMAVKDENGCIIYETKTFNVGEVKRKNKAEYRFWLEKWLNKHSNLTVKDPGGLFDGMPVFMATDKEPQIRDTICFWGLGLNNKWMIVETYGPKLVENCLAGNTKVLTLRGVINIFEVTNQDQVWDGIEWVKCGGVISKGIQDTITVNGVQMTPDHKILTENGWKTAEACQGLSRVKSALPDCDFIRRYQREKIFMERPLSLWYRKNSPLILRGKRCKILWMHAQEINRATTNNTRNEQASGVRSLAFNARPLSSSYAPSLAQLRRPGYNSMRQVENVSRLLGRHEGDIRARVNIRPERCERQLPKGELPLGNFQRTGSKQTRQSFNRNGMGSDNSSRSFGTIRNRRNNINIPSRSQLPERPFILQAGFYEPVYDILNCGPRNRFTVFDVDRNPFIVHNCDQAISRDLLMHAIVNCEKAGHDIILSIHDELGAEVYKKDGVTLEQIEKLMLDLPEWAKDWPVKADGFVADYYQK